MRVWDLNDGCCDANGVIIVDFNTDEPVGIFIPGPPGSSAGILIETETTDTEITVDARTEYVVVWATSPIEINLPFSSSRMTENNGSVYTLPLTIKNETGVEVTFNPGVGDTLEIASEGYQNQSVTLLPRVGGYSAI